MPCAGESKTAAPSSDCTAKLALETATTQTTPVGRPLNRVPQALLALVAIPFSNATTYSIYVTHLDTFKVMERALINKPNHEFITLDK